MITILFLHPFILFAIENLFTALIGGFTLPQSVLRPLGLCPLLACLYYSLNYSIPAYLNTTGILARPFGSAFALQPLLHFDRLILRRWAFGNVEIGVIKRPDIDTPSEGKRKRQRPDTFRERLTFGNEISSSARGVGTFWEVKNVPPFSSKDPSYVPSRVDFITRHAIAAILCYTAYNIATEIQLQLDDSLLIAEKVPLLSRMSDISKSELQVRFINTLAHWVQTYSFLQTGYSAAALIGVAINPSELRLWRPLFGSLSESYTIRGFWGVFWHQTLRANLSGPATFLTHSVFRLPPKTLAARYTQTLMVFFLSGLTHIGCDMGSLLPYAQTGAVRFFCTQAIGIMIEDGVQAFHRYIRGSKISNAKVPLWHRIVGFIWLIVFLTWSTPAWMFPMTRNMTREDAFVNLTTLRSLIPLRW